MRAATAVGATAILILVTAVWVCPAGAEDAIKPGKWEYWIVGLKVREPLPGTQLPPSQRWGPEGLINSFCLSETNLKTPHSHARSTPALHGKLGKGSCDSDMTTDAATATRSFSTDCAFSSGSESHIGSIVHFHGDTLEGTAMSRFSFPNQPTTERTFPIKGRYVGPCDSK